MTIALAAGAAALSIVGAIGHSVISERKFLRPLYAEPRTGLFASRSARAIARGIFHMPSMVWVVLGLASSLRASRAATCSSALSPSLSSRRPAQETSWRSAARISAACCWLSREH